MRGGDPWVMDKQVQLLAISHQRKRSLVASVSVIDGRHLESTIILQPCFYTPLLLLSKQSLFAFFFFCCCDCLVLHLVRSTFHVMLSQREAI